jgi:GR25 family glycosyltransferase involved in LPS biosynthesis
MSNAMISLPSYFGAALVINLAERTDRRSSVKRELLNVGWTDYQFFPACRFDDAAGFKFPSWRGCFHSHLDCFRLAQQQNLKNILILEDDIALSSSIRRLAPTIIEAIRQLDWDLLYFGHELTGDILRASRKTEVVSFERCDIEIRTTHCYAVNGRILPRLIAHFERLATGAPGDDDFGPMLPDGAINTFRRHNKDVTTYITNPKLGWQRPSRSDISPHRVDGVDALRPFVNLARKCRHFWNRCLNGF